MTPVQEFHTSEEMRRCYLDAKSKLWGPRPKPIRFVPPPPSIPKNDLPVHAPVRKRVVERPNDSDKFETEIARIQRYVCTYYDISRADLLSARRDAKVIKPRHVAAYLCKTLTLKSLPDIGRRFGGRDHTTILNSVKKITVKLATDEDLAKDIKTITEWWRA